MFLNITSAANKYSSIDCYFQKKKNPMLLFRNPSISYFKEPKINL